MRLTLRLLKWMSAIITALAIFVLATWFWFAWQLPPLQTMLDAPLPVCETKSQNPSTRLYIQPWQGDALQAVEGVQTMRWYAARLLYQDRSRTIERQLKTVVLSHLLALNLSRTELSAVIFDRAYFGKGANGLGCAAATLYNKDVIDLSLAQFAMLIGLIKGPTFYHPARNPSAALKRRNDVLDIWLAKGIATKQQVDAAKLEPL